MAVNLKGESLPQGATVSIRIEMTAQANITPFVARQKVTQLVVLEISSQLRGETPDLHVGELTALDVVVAELVEGLSRAGQHHDAGAFGDAHARNEQQRCRRYRRDSK